MSEAYEPPTSTTGRNVVIGVLVIGVLSGGGFWLASRRGGGGNTPTTPGKLPEPKLHRATAATCAPSKKTRPRDPQLEGCTGDADCTKGANGRCESFMVKHAKFENVCRYDECSTDADCGDSWSSSKGPCICGGSDDVNQCLPGNCKVDADCGPGGWCSPSIDWDCGYEGGRGHWCHTADDECTNDSDCTPGASSGMPSTCRYDPHKDRWACTVTQCHKF